VAALEDRWHRAVAELDHVRGAQQRDQHGDHDRGQERARVTAEWLPVVDNLELALQHARAHPSAAVTSLRAIRDHALAVLTGLGFPRRSDVGERFDADRHDAVAILADPHAPEGTVLHIVRPGYGTDDNLLRPAAVVVAERPVTRPGQALR
jgi:molecular chaperone GrpE